MLRAAMKAATPVGAKAKGYVDKGELVPDSIMIELIETALKPLGNGAKVLLDGFPRTVPQAQALDANDRTKVARAISFEIPEEILVQRLTGRRVCPQCGESFHIELMRPKKEGICDKCGGALVQRKDDSEDVVKTRLEVFKKQNSGLLSYYENAKKLKALNADQEVSSLQSQLLKFF